MPNVSGVLVDDHIESVNWHRSKTDLAADNFDNGRSAAALRTSFERSQPVVFAWLDGRLIGMARVLSDGVCNASLLDVWTQSTIRKRGVAREMVNHLAAALPGQHLGLKTDDAEQFHTALGFWPQPQFMSLVVGGWLDNQANRR